MIQYLCIHFSQKVKLNKIYFHVPKNLRNIKYKKYFKKGLKKEGKAITVNKNKRYFPLNQSQYI